MNTPNASLRVKTVLQLYELLLPEERIITDVLRQLIAENLPPHCKEKISYNVPFFYGNKGICIVWPASIPRGGISEGVLLGFWYGNRLQDVDGYLQHGTNKQIYYRVFKQAEEINDTAILKLLQEAVVLDDSWASKKNRAKPGSIKRVS